MSVYVLLNPFKRVGEKRSDARRLVEHFITFGKELNKFNNTVA